MTIMTCNLSHRQAWNTVKMTLRLLNRYILFHTYAAGYLSRPLSSKAGVICSAVALQALENERAAPELLHFQRDLVARLQAAVQQRVRFSYLSKFCCLHRLWPLE